jgi:DNA-binding CsgD family transcriptional regulator
MSAFHRDGINTTEREILDLWDADLSAQAIARRLGRSPRFVATTLSRLLEGNETRLHVAAMRSGSNALLAAMKEARHV